MVKKKNFKGTGCRRKYRALTHCEEWTSVKAKPGGCQYFLVTMPMAEWGHLTFAMDFEADNLWERSFFASDLKALKQHFSIGQEVFGTSGNLDLEQVDLDPDLSE